MSASGSGEVLLLAVAGGAIGDGRTGAVVAAVVALISTAIGGLALARANGRIGWGGGARSGAQTGAGARAGSAGGAGAWAGAVRGWAVAALVVGLAGVALGVLHLATSSGGFGTGNGRAGAIVAMLIGATGMALGRLALTRSRGRTVATG